MKKWVIIVAAILVVLCMIGSVSAATYTSHYPPGYSAVYVNATSEQGANYLAYLAANPTLSDSGSAEGLEWLSGSPTFQRINFDLGASYTIRNLSYQNHHSAGVDTVRGAKNFSLWCSNSHSDFMNVAYANASTWTQLTPVGANSTGWFYFKQHSAVDAADWQSILVDNPSTSCRYFSIKIANNWQDTPANYVGLRRVVFNTEDGYLPTPISSFSSVNVSIATNTTSQGWAGNAPFTMQFTNTSTNPPHTSWVWNYTKSGESTPVTFNQTGYYNPRYTFASAGNYSISLNVTSTSGSNISTQITWVNVTADLPVVSFNSNATTGVNPMAVQFNDTSISAPAIQYYNTSFGDGFWENQTTFPATNITHLYSTQGNYTVSHYVTNAQGTGSATGTIVVWGTANSQFSIFNIAGTARFTTYLYDTSTNLTPGPVTYGWDLGDGNTSTAQNLYFTWNKTGTYTINHSVNNSLSVSYSTANITVGTPTPPVVAPVAAFYGGPQIGYPPLHVFLTDVSSNTPTSWNWSFGDGTYSTSQNPSHWYNSSGFFTVGLTATNSAGSNSTTQTDFIMVY